MCKGTSKSSIHQEKTLFSLPEIVSDKKIRVDFDIKKEGEVRASSHFSHLIKTLRPPMIYRPLSVLAVRVPSRR